MGQWPSQSWSEDRRGHLHPKFPLWPPFHCYRPEGLKRQVTVSPSAYRATSACMQGGQGISVQGETLIKFEFHSLTSPLIPLAFLSSSAPHWMLHLPQHPFGLPEFISLRKKISFAFDLGLVRDMKYFIRLKKSIFFPLFKNFINDPVTCHIIMTVSTVEEGTVWFHKWWL